MYMVLPEADLATQIGNIGIAEDSEVVFYTTEMLSCATRAWWLLRYAGHNNVRVLNGGLAAWKKAGGKIEQEARQYEPSQFESHLRPNMFASKEEVQAAAVNPLDWHYLRGKPFFMCLMAGLLKPKNRMLGVDLAGRVEAVGRNVKAFQPGDEVFGSGQGSFAEFVCVTENNLVLKPANCSFAEAAAVPVAALTALQGLRDTGQIQPGQKVLINGASGGGPSSPRDR